MLASNQLDFCRSRGLEAKSFGLGLSLTLSGPGLDLHLMAFGLIEIGSAHDIN